MISRFNHQGGDHASWPQFEMNRFEKASQRFALDLMFQHDSSYANV